MTRLPDASAQIHHHLRYQGSISWIAVIPSISLKAIRMKAVLKIMFAKTRFRIVCSDDGCCGDQPSEKMRGAAIFRLRRSMLDAERERVANEKAHRRSEEHTSERQSHPYISHAA